MKLDKVVQKSDCLETEQQELEHVISVNMQWFVMETTAISLFQKLKITFRSLFVISHIIIGDPPNTQFYRYTLGCLVARGVGICGWGWKHQKKL